MYKLGSIQLTQSKLTFFVFSLQLSLIQLLATIIFYGNNRSQISEYSYRGLYFYFFLSNFLLLFGTFLSLYRKRILLIFLILLILFAVIEIMLIVFNSTNFLDPHKRNFFLKFRYNFGAFLSLKLVPVVMALYILVQSRK